MAGQGKVIGQDFQGGICGLPGIIAGMNKESK
jgi:hypothetical protein